MNYILKHWRGELSLSVSFWINLFLLNLIVQGFTTWFSDKVFFQDPQIAARFGLGFVVTKFLLVYPWQVVGLVRSSYRYIETTGKKLWAHTAQLAVFLGLCVTVVNITLLWPTYKAFYQMGFEKDPFANYTLQLVKDDTIIHLTGGLGFGISDDVAALLMKNRHITAIILDSAGGRLYEGRQLAKLIRVNRLNTYSSKGCYSACTTAFIAGERRFLTIESNLAFHQGRHTYGGNEEYFVSQEKEQEIDLQIFRNQGVSEDFLDTMYSASSDDMWYPTTDELIEANVVHQIILTSDILPEDHEYTSEELDELLLDEPLFATLKKYEPETYQRILDEVDARLQMGASIVEMQTFASEHIETLLTRYLPRSHDDTLILFVTHLMKSLRTIMSMDPILCLKYLDPEQFGSMNVSDYLPDDQKELVNETINQVFVDAHEGSSPVPVVDQISAENVVNEVVTVMGDDALYLTFQGLQNREDYKKACDAAINMYELILAQGDEKAANTLRYLFGEA